MARIYEAGQSKKKKRTPKVPSPPPGSGRAAPAVGFAKATKRMSSGTQMSMAPAPKARMSYHPLERVSRSQMKKWAKSMGIKRSY